MHCHIETRCRWACSHPALALAAGLLAWMSALVANPAPVAAQVLETETARMLPKHSWEIGGAYELQTSGEGREGALPFAIEYGLTDWLDLLIEPVPYTAIRPKVGRQASGAGDLEATATLALIHEGAHRPAFAFAAEVKIPTARDFLIGTGKTDYAGYAIASKRFGIVDTHANIAYTISGQPGGVHLNNIVSFALGSVADFGKNELFGEFLGSTAASPEGPEKMADGAPAIVPEAAGGELVGTLGVGRSFVEGMLTYLSVSVDNNGAILFRPGFVLHWR
jgi:hypothetical protein